MQVFERENTTYKTFGCFYMAYVGAKCALESLIRDTRGVQSSSEDRAAFPLAFSKDSSMANIETGRATFAIGALQGAGAKSATCKT